MSGLLLNKVFAYTPPPEPCTSGGMTAEDYMRLQGIIPSSCTTFGGLSSSSTCSNDYSNIINSLKTCDEENIRDYNIRLRSSQMEQKIIDDATQQNKVDAYNTQTQQLEAEKLELEIDKFKLYSNQQKLKQRHQKPTKNITLTKYNGIATSTKSKDLFITGEIAKESNKIYGVFKIFNNSIKADILGEFTPSNKICFSGYEAIGNDNITIQISNCKIFKTHISGLYQTKYDSGSIDMLISK